MPFAFAILVGFQLVGEVVRLALSLPLPGPLIGMFLLAVALAAGRRGRAAETNAASMPPSPLVQASSGLISHMGLLFVPAGVGVVAELGVVREQWLPILVALIVSTVLGLAVTALVMHHVSRVIEAQRPIVPRAAHRQEAH
jgi:putative effector of murein hydrolase LrgA (UPF0299 family)